MTELTVKNEWKITALLSRSIGMPSPTSLNWLSSAASWVLNAAMMKTTRSYQGIGTKSIKVIEETITVIFAINKTLMELASWLVRSGRMSANTPGSAPNAWWWVTIHQRITQKKSCSTRCPSHSSSPARYILITEIIRVKSGSASVTIWRGNWISLMIGQNANPIYLLTWLRRIMKKRTTRELRSFQKSTAPTNYASSAFTSGNCMNTTQRKIILNYQLDHKINLIWSTKIKKLNYLQNPPKKKASSNIRKSAKTSLRRTWWTRSSALRLTYSHTSHLSKTSTETSWCTLQVSKPERSRKAHT